MLGKKNRRGFGDINFLICYGGKHAHDPEYVKRRAFSFTEKPAIAPPVFVFQKDKAQKVSEALCPFVTVSRSREMAVEEKEKHCSFRLTGQAIISSLLGRVSIIDLPPSSWSGSLASVCA